MSRRPSRSGNRSSDAGRDSEYDDYEYAPDGYARGDQDDSWSANEYFSPDGIKGRWAAGHQPGEQPAVRPNRYEDDGDSFQGGYGTGENATGAYDLSDGAPPDRSPSDGADERGGRKRKDRPERGSRLRLRRDRGEDIWPDDGVSDEDYWASVAADRPLTPTNPPPDADPVSAGGDSRAPAGARPGSEPRGGTGRLGPAPGQGQAPRNSGGFPQPDAAQQSFRPSRSDRPGGSDWGERTERIDRVTATGYPDPRPSSRSSGAPGRGRDDAGREPDQNSGSWPAARRSGGQASVRAAGDEDPLTSTAYSRSAQAEADGRSYRVAARRSQAQAKLPEETQTFGAPVAYPGDRYPGGQYQPGQRPAGRSQTGEHSIPRYATGGTGEYGQYDADQYRGSQQRGAPEEPTARYPVHGVPPGQPARPGGNSGRVSLPGASGALTGQYPTQPAQPRQPRQPRQPQQRPQPQQAQQPRPQSQPTPAAGGNPYDSAVTGSYPYPGQAGYPSRGTPPPQAPTGPGANGNDDRRRRPAPPDVPRDGRY